MSSISFAYPWILLAFPVLVVLPLLRRHKVQSILATRCLVKAGGGTIRRWGASFILPALRILFLLILVVCAARPQYKTVLPFEKTEKRNLVLAIDTSRSMEAQDFISTTGVTSRMEGVKRVTNDFLRNRVGDRIGIVLFGSHAYLQAPLTLDHDFLRALLIDIRPGVAGDGTAIGDGIGTALKHIQALPADTRAIILLTDGVNTSGAVEPMKAARIAADLGIRIYTIGIGSQSGSFIPSIRGLPLSQQLSAAFDESALRRISEVSGGSYYFASNEEELNKIYREIESLETAETEAPTPPVSIQEIAPSLLWLVLGIFLLHALLSQTVLRVLP